LTCQLHEVLRIKDCTQRERAELAAQLKNSEEARDAMRRDVMAAKRRIKEGHLMFAFMLLGLVEVHIPLP